MDLNAAPECPQRQLRKVYWPTVSGVEDNLAPDGGVFVSDRGNHCVAHWAPGAEAGTVVAGGQGWSDRLDQLPHPYGVFLASFTPMALRWLQTPASLSWTVATTLWCTGRL